MSDLFLDIETLDWIGPDRDISRIRFGIAVTCAVRDGESWMEWYTGEAAGLWSQISCAERVIGWNITSFDLPIIARAVGREFSPALCVVDLFDEIRRDTGRWYKLGDVAERNLRRGKSGNGVVVVDWLNSGDPALVRKAFNYCRDDVELVKELFAKAERGLWLPTMIRKGNYYAEVEWRLGQ